MKLKVVVHEAEEDSYGLKSLLYPAAPYKRHLRRALACPRPLGETDDRSKQFVRSMAR